MKDLQICISVYKKSYTELMRMVNSIPSDISIRIDIDGGWEFDWSNEEFSNLMSLDNVKVVQHYFNHGLAKIRNEQLRECTHEYIQWVDADDYLNGKVVRQFLNYNSDMFVTPVRLITKDGTFIEDRNCRVATSGYQTYFVIPSIIFKTKFLKDNQLEFDESGNIFEDIIFSAKLSLLSPTVWVSYTPYYNYICDVDGSLSHPEKIQKTIDSTIYFIEKLYELPRVGKIYTRVIEECLRILALPDLPDELRLKLVNYMKPYKFFK